MAVRLAFNEIQQYFDTNGIPLAGGKLFTYAAGSSTKQTAYQDSGGLTPHANPIVLDSSGYLPAALWITQGSSYKLVMTRSTDTDPPVSPIWTIDNISGINDSTVTIDEWVASGLTPTYVSATSFTLAGDQTSIFHEGRRLKSTNTGGTVYSTVTNSVFGASTTVTVVNDSSSLDSGLSAVSVGIIRANNPSISSEMIHRKGSAAITAAATTDIWNTQGDYVHISGTTGISSFGTAPYAGMRKKIIHDAALTITNGSNLACPGDQDLAVKANTAYEVIADTTTAHRIFDVVHAFSRPPQIDPGYLFGLKMANGGDAVNDIDIATGACRDKDDTMDIVLASALTKQLDAVWAVGTNQGGRASGAAIANTTYHVFLIKRSDTGVVDAAYDTSATGANIAANTNAAYTTIRRIGSIVRAGGTILAFTQDGDLFQLSTGVADISANAPGTAAVTRTLASVPTGLNIQAWVHAMLQNNSAATTAFLYLSDLSTTDTAASATFSDNGTTFNAAAGSGNTSSKQYVRTNTSAQIRSRVGGIGDGNVTLTINTLGWIDSRGRYA